MSLFASVLHGIQKKIDATTAYKAPIIACIYDVIHLTLTPDNIISLKEGILTLRVNPTIKAVIILKQAVLLQAMKERSINITQIK